MTQVPEYLLERSRARRAALGLGGDAPASPAPISAPSESGASPAPAAGGVAAAAPAPAAASVAAPPAPMAPLPEYVTDPGPKSGIPFWMMPILLLLPLWAIVYMGSFGNRAVENAAPTPSQIFASNCAVCHGARGQGGAGPALEHGDAAITFPNEQDQIEWVTNGSSARKGQPYGEPNRPGGQRIATTGGMPAFGGRLTPDEIKAVVEYERTAL